jgi:hypothetical protein
MMKQVSVLRFQGFKVLSSKVQEKASLLKPRTRNGEPRTLLLKRKGGDDNQTCIKEEVKGNFKSSKD